MDIHEDEIRCSFLDHLDCGLDFAGVADHGDVVGELAAHAGAKQIVVVHHEDPNGS